MRTELEIRARLQFLKNQESEFKGVVMGDSPIRKILRAQIKGLLFALGEEKDFKITGE